MNELRAWLALQRAPLLGSSTMQKLLAHFPSPQTVLDAPRRDLEALGILKPPTLDYLALPDWYGVDRDLAWGGTAGRRIITAIDPDYPQLLREIPGGNPPVLFIHGNVHCLAAPQVAMVGTRKPSPGGETAAYNLAAEIARRGLIVTSGLALGIDAASHRGALAAPGSTIAVAATGLDRVYPARHRDLAEQIAANGALVSEFPIGTRPLRENFPRRNRIISGLARGTVVVEAALRSGSLITARFAADQGREVLAVPGSIFNPLSKGCHALIKEGAKLAETADDIVEELGLSVAQQGPAGARGTGNLATRTELKTEQNRVFKALGYEAMSIDDLARSTGLTAEVVSSILMEMELEGFVTSVSGGLYTRHAVRGAK